MEMKSYTISQYSTISIHIVQFNSTNQTIDLQHRNLPYICISEMSLVLRRPNLIPPSMVLTQNTLSRSLLRVYICVQTLMEDMHNLHQNIDVKIDFSIKGFINYKWKYINHSYLCKQQLTAPPTVEPIYWPTIIYAVWSTKVILPVTRNFGQDVTKNPKPAQT